MLCRARVIAWEFVINGGVAEPLDETPRDELTNSWLCRIAVVAEVVHGDAKKVISFGNAHWMRTAKEEVGVLLASRGLCPCTSHPVGGQLTEPLRSCWCGLLSWLSGSCFVEQVSCDEFPCGRCPVELAVEALPAAVACELFMQQRVD